MLVKLLLSLLFLLRTFSLHFDVWGEPHVCHSTCMSWVLSYPGMELRLSGLGRAPLPAEPSLNGLFLIQFLLIIINFLLNAARCGGE